MLLFLTSVTWCQTEYDRVAGDGYARVPRARCRCSVNECCPGTKLLNFFFAFGVTSHDFIFFGAKCMVPAWERACSNKTAAYIPHVLTRALPRVRVATRYCCASVPRV